MAADRLTPLFPLIGRRRGGAPERITSVGNTQEFLRHQRGSRLKSPDASSSAKTALVTGRPALIYYNHSHLIFLLSSSSILPTHSFPYISSYYLSSIGCSHRRHVTTIKYGKGLRAKPEQVIRPQEDAHYGHAHDKIQLVEAYQLAERHPHRGHSYLRLRPGHMDSPPTEYRHLRCHLLFLDWTGYHSWYVRLNIDSINIY